jgi:hypothetical protein
VQRNARKLGIGRGLGLGMLLLGMGAMTVPFAATSAGAQTARSALAAKSHKSRKAPKTPTKCTAHVLGPALKSATQGSSYKVDSVGCSGDWAYAIFTSGGTKQVDVLEYDKGLTVWIPDNTTAVCHKGIVPGPIKAKACKGALPEVQ